MKERKSGWPNPLVSIAVIMLFFSCSNDKNNHRIQVVKTFADNVYDKGLDRWSGRNTPLLADGINVDTHEPVEWVYREKNGEVSSWIIHNLASQQNLFRTLVGLTNLTGDKKYREIAEMSLRYHFDSLASECGLLRWGGHQIMDLRTLQPYGHFDANCHELKENFPFYELMWEVDKEATARFVRAFWNAHVLDWNILDMTRHGNYGMPLGKLWDNDFNQPEPFFEGIGLTFWVAAADLIYGGGMLYHLNKEEGALKWTKLLADQYVRARHPKTGLGVYQYSKPKRRREPPEGPLTGTLTYSSYGDRAENQFGKDFPDVAREGWVLFNGSVYTNFFLIQMEVAELLGDKGKELLSATVDGIKAYIKYAYDASRNQFKPMWADGTDLTGYAFPRTGYYGPEGKVLEPFEANELYLFSFSRAYRLSRDNSIWEAVRSMMKGLDLGDPGNDPENPTGLNFNTGNSKTNALFALLELNKIAKNNNYLKLAEAVGDNLIKRSFHHGFFLEDADHINAKFDATEPLALLTLEAALQGKLELVPVYSGGDGYIHGQFIDMGRTYDSRAIWSKKREITMSQ